MDEKRDNEEYSIPLKNSPGLQDCPQFVYSVDDGTLPSNIRSVFLTKVQLTREYQRSRVCLGTCCSRPKETDEKARRKRKLWLLCGLVVVITTFVTAFAVWELLRKTSQTPLIQQWDMKEGTNDIQEPGQEEDVSRQQINKIQSVVDKTSFLRTPCRKVCWDFSAFKFRSTCLHGFCRCDGHGYNPNTCLPDIDGCVMQTGDVPYAEASKNGERKSLYSCKQKRREGNAIHVFSVFGMGDSTSTEIELQGANNGDITVVLSSYQKVNWVVRPKDGVRLDQIVMMQTSNSGESSLVLEELQTTEYPTIMSYRRQSGYGDDREGGHTVQLLQAITQEVGQITTFTGSKYADYFSLNLALLSKESL